MNTEQDFNAQHGIDAKTLIRKYAEGTATEQESEIFEQWYHSLNREGRVNLSEISLEAAEQELMEALIKGTEPVTVHTIPYWRRAAAVAAVLLALLGGYFIYTNQTKTSSPSAGVAANIVPGKNTATLTLPDGKVIQLSESKTGVVIDAASLAYSDGSAVDGISEASGVKADTGVIITASTPRGGTYQFILPDGSKVWLNAESQLQFRSVFKGSRTVKLKGEAFFEVAGSHSQPFMVEGKEQTIKVLGTQFNVNNYHDEPSAKTTLLEGAVQVQLNSSGQQVRLQSGQQSTASQAMLKAVSIDASEIEQAIAWKNGDFVFDADIKTIMKQIARWYNVDITYKGPVSREELVGKISRSKNLGQVLKVLESTNSVHFEIQGRNITVMQ